MHQINHQSIKPIIHTSMIYLLIHEATIHLFIHPFIIHPSNQLSIHSSIHLSNQPFTHQSICSSILLFIYLFADSFLSWRQQVQKGNPGIPLLGDTLHLLLRDPKEFHGKRGNMIPPTCSRSSPREMYLENFQRHQGGI